MSFLVSQGDTVSSKAVHYINIFEKIVQNNVSQCLWSEDGQKQERYTENYLTIVTMSKLSNLFESCFFNL